MKISDKTKIIQFLKKIKKQTGVNNVVIGMSGGIDSTTVFFLLKEVYKPDQIYPAILNYYQKNNDDILNILKAAKIPKKNILNMSIKTIVDQFFVEISSEAKTDKNESETGPAQIRLGNVMARVRMIVLFDLAKRINGLVCGTENKTEHYLGYFTRFGDAASDIEPISHLYKYQVYKLAKYLKVPDEFIVKKPSANLWKNQTDEGEFGFTYEEADQVLKLFYDKKININSIKKQGFANAEKIIKRVKSNQFKQLVPYHL